jgi:cell division protein FtsL
LIRSHAAARPELGAVVRTILSFALLVPLLVTYAAGRVSVIDLGYTLSHLRQEQQELSRENARLKLQVLTLRAPARLEKVAREQLGMAPPDPLAVLRETGPKPRRVELPDRALAERR